MMMTLLHASKILKAELDEISASRQTDLPAGITWRGRGYIRLMPPIRHKRLLSEWWQDRLQADSRFGYLCRRSGQASGFKPPVSEVGRIRLH